MTRMCQFVLLHYVHYVHMSHKIWQANMFYFISELDVLFFSVCLLELFYRWKQVIAMAMSAIAIQENKIYTES